MTLARFSIVMVKLYWMFLRADIMKLEKSKKRDKQRNKKKSGMVTDNKSIFTIQEIQIKKSEQKKDK
jgi:hypothetical protein